MSRIDCPDFHSWQALLEGDRSEGDIEGLARHLETCSDCQQTLEVLAATSAPWEDTARSLGEPQRKMGAEPALRHVVERLKGEPLPAGEVDLSFLQPADDPNLLGLLDLYQVQEVIGRGGMGVVLKAFDPHLHRLVAIKVLDPTLAGNATARRRFMRETQAAAAVCHDHVVAVHAVDEVNGLPYLVMQYVPGESLQARLDREGSLAALEVVRIGLQTAAGLAAAHAQGLIHRDIKPANLLLENGLSRVKITDFGLARMSDDMGLTQNGVVAGTPEYMAPEQARAEVVDHRADLFSLGSVLYACCTGRPPFRGSTALAVLSQVNEKEPLPIRSLNVELPTWLEALIVRLMAKDPAERFQSASAVAQLLEGCLAHLQQPTTVPVPEVLSSPRRSAHLSCPRFATRLPLRAWLSVLAGLVVLGLGMSFWFRAGVQSVEPAGLDRKKPPVQARGDNQGKQDHLMVDFAAGIDKLPPSVSLFGPDVESVIKTDPQGWRITLPAGRRGAAEVGLKVSRRLSGDFAITLGYELLAVGRPLPQYGAGLLMRVFFDAPSSPTAILSYSDKPEGRMFGAHKTINGPDNHDQYLANMHAKELSRNNLSAYMTMLLQNQPLAAVGCSSYFVTAPKAARSRGKLRLVRSGSLLQYFVAEDGQDFRRIQSVRIGTADVPEVQVYGQTMYAPIALDMRLTELDIRADRIDNPNDSAPERKQDQLVVDLASGIDKLPPSLSLFGPNVESVVKADPQGWRFILPAGRGNTDLVGVEGPSRLSGDFAITLGYELLAVGEPWPKFGAGAWIQVWFDTPSFLSAMLSRNNSSYHNPPQEVFAAFKIVKDPDGQEKYLDAMTERAHRPRGKLRLERIGSRLHYLVAEEGQEFRKLQSIPIGTADVRELRVYCSTTYTPTALDVRWTHLDIRADRIDGQDQPATLEPVSSEQPSQHPRSKKWLMALTLFVVIVLSSGAIAWFIRRRSRRAEEHVSAAVVDKQRTSSPIVPALSFSCSGCGKRLKAKPELAGKKVKCPQCGKAVLVPVTGEPEPGRTSS